MTACKWCGTAICQGSYLDALVWLAVDGPEKRIYEPLTCEESEDVRHDAAMALWFLAGNKPSTSSKPDSSTDGNDPSQGSM